LRIWRSISASADTRASNCSREMTLGALSNSFLTQASAPGGGIGTAAVLPVRRLSLSFVLVLVLSLVLALPSSGPGGGGGGGGVCGDGGDGDGDGAG